MLSKEEQYCAKVKVVTPHIAAVIGMYRFYLVRVPDLKVIDSAELSAMIEFVDAKDGIVAILTADEVDEEEEEGDKKLLHSWEIGKEGKIVKKHDPV